MSENKKTELKLLPVLACAVVGVVLLLYGSIGKDSSNKENSIVQEISAYDETKYEEELTKKVEDVCSQIAGAGKVKVAITLDGSYRAIYAQNSADGSSVKREYFLVGSGSSESALLLGYSPPQILGIAIVCDGGNNARVRAEIISLVSALLDLPTNKIYVAAAKN